MKKNKILKNFFLTNIKGRRQAHKDIDYHNKLLLESKQIVSLFADLLFVKLAGTLIFFFCNYCYYYYFHHCLQ